MMLRTALLLLAACIAAPAAAAAQEAEPDGDTSIRRVQIDLDVYEPHSLDGLEEMAQPAPATLPPLIGSMTIGVTAPFDRRFNVGGESIWRAGYAVHDGLYLGGGFGLVVFEGEPFDALPEGTLFQFQALLSIDWILPLRESRDPYGNTPALRLSLSPGFVGGEYQERRSDKQRLRELNQQLETSLFGGVARFEAAFDLPLVEIEGRALFLSFGATYQWGLAQANFKLRDKNGANPSISDEEVIRLDALSAWIGFTARF